jgi:hypothetical protein
MITTGNRYLALSLFGLVLTAGCAARDVEVRSPVQGQATVEGDTGSTSTRSRTETTTEKQSEQRKTQSQTSPGY